MKVTIIGASISGLFLAYHLAKGGVEVEVFERIGELGWPPRTLIVTDKFFEILDFDPEEAILNKINYLELFSRSRTARLKLSEPDLVVERGKLLHLLARLAEDEGAKVLLRHQFQGFAQFGKKILVTIKDLETGEDKNLSTDILIGADGAMSAVSQIALGNGHLLKALLQARAPMPEKLNADTTQIWFDADRTNYFCWMIPESVQIAAVGLIAENPQEAKESLNIFLQEREMEPLEFQSAVVPMHRLELTSNVQSPSRNIFIVGDAAAQVKVTTVGGVVTGLYGARALANSILKGGDYHRELRELKLELDLHLLLRKVLNYFSNEDYDKLISMLDGGLKEILEEWTRDELRQSFLKLIWNEPRLINLGAKALVRSIIH